MRNLFKQLFHKTTHKHVWIEKDYRRECNCGARQLLMMNKYPSLTKPSLEWVTTARGNAESA